METSEKTVAVTVTDEGDGKISVTAVPDQNAQEGNDFTFTNVYNVDPAESSLTGDGGFVLKKVLKANTDRVLGEGEFTFRLIDPADGSVAAETTNAADGTISMPAQNFTEPGSAGRRVQLPADRRRGQRDRYCEERRERRGNV